MVLMLMTPALVAVLQKYPDLQQEPESDDLSGEPSLSMPEVGKPVSHGQILDIFKHVKRHSEEDIHLQDLLRGSQVYIPPPRPRVEPTSEYKELMARLRREEESKAYAKMLNAPPASTNPFEKFTAPKTAAAWDLQPPDDQIDDLKMSEVNQQLALVINVLLSIIACGIAAWIILRHWSAPVRLALSMSCGGIVGVAEVGIYAAYIRKLSEAKSTEKSNKETKVVTDTWVIEPSKKNESEILVKDDAGTKDSTSLRRRRQ